MCLFCVCHVYIATHSRKLRCEPSYRNTNYCQFDPDMGILYVYTHAVHNDPSDTGKTSIARLLVIA